jgi:N-acetylmuramic acid 6-phosphate etherase
MVDIQARNAKLRARAVRMLCELTDCTPATARSALDDADGKVKLAVLLVHGMTRVEAETLLALNDGSLRLALRTPPAERR